MEFLKNLFGNESLTYDQFAEKVRTANINLADLSRGDYVSVAKHTDTTKKLQEQVQDLQAQITKRDTDMQAIQQQLAAAQTDAGKLTEAQNSLTALQGKYEKEKKDWEAKTQKQAYEFAVKQQADKLQFSSKAAQAEFMRGAMAAGFKLDGDNLLGYSDWLKKYQTEDPGAFKDTNSGGGDGGEQQNGSAPSIVMPVKQTAPAGAGFNFNFRGVRPHPQE